LALPLALAVVAVGLANPAAGDAPCSWQRHLIEGNGVDVFGAANDETGGVWVAGSSQSLSMPFRSLNFIARWDGSAWVQTPVPQPAPMDGEQSLRAVIALGPDDAIAVGAADAPDGSIRTTPQSFRWDGSSWSTMDSPTFDGGGSFTDAALAGDAVWATGAKNDSQPYDALVEPFAARLDGDGWQTFALPPFDIVDSQSLARYRLRAVGGAAAGDVWLGGWLLVSGEAIDDAVLARWNGSDWTWFDVRPLLVNPGAGSSIEAITALAPDDVWAAGYEFDVTTGRNVALLLHWDGVEWSRVAAPNEPGRSVWLRDVVARSSDDIYAAGVVNTPGEWPEGYLLHHDGVAWSRVDNVQTAAGSQFLAAATTTDGTLWLAGLTNEFPVLGLAQRAVLCVGDLDGDGDVDQADLGILLGDWGCTGDDCVGDIDGDGDTDQADLGALLAHYGS
jgi:hypothetical protein